MCIVIPIGRNKALTIDLYNVEVYFTIHCTINPNK